MDKVFWMEVLSSTGRKTRTISAAYIRMPNCLSRRFDLSSSRSIGRNRLGNRSSNEKFHRSNQRPISNASFVQRQDNGQKSIERYVRPRTDFACTREYSSFLFVERMTVRAAERARLRWKKACQIQLWKETPMNQNFIFHIVGGIAFITLNATFLQPSANAQAPTKPESSQMKTGMDMKVMKPGDIDMKGMMIDMNEKMSSMKMSGNPDVDFAMMMRIHHEGAIQMAEVELRDGKEANMKKMAKDIIAAQKKEIAQMDKFINIHQNMPSKTTK